MKPETQKKLDLIVPLIAHLLEGGALQWKFGVKTAPQRAQDIGSIEAILNAPEHWSIHREPRVVYLTAHKGEFQFPPHQTPAEHTCAHCTDHRFVEDVDWKPEPK